MVLHKKIWGHRPWFEFLEIVQSLDVSSGLVCTTFCLWIISRLTDGQMRLQRTKCLAVETKAQDCLSYQFESERVINWSEKEDVVDLEQTITILSTWQSLKKILEMDDWKRNIGQAQWLILDRWYAPQLLHVAFVIKLLQLGRLHQRILFSKICRKVESYILLLYSVNTAAMLIFVEMVIVYYASGGISDFNKTCQA